MALEAARAAQGHIGRARRLATDEEARRRRRDVLSLPSRVTGLGQAIDAAAALVRAAEEEAKATAEELNESETSALRQALGRAPRAGCRAAPRARSRSWRTGRSHGPPGSSATPSTGPCWTWPPITATC